MVLLGKERHDIGRPNDGGYPVIGIVKDNYAYTINFNADRSPACNPETGYLNTDGSPTKSAILIERRKEDSKYWDLNFGKRDREELYDIKLDAYCMANLAADGRSYGLVHCRTSMGPSRYDLEFNLLWDK